MCTAKLFQCCDLLLISLQRPKKAESKNNLEFRIIKMFYYKFSMKAIIKNIFIIN